MSIKIFQFLGVRLFWGHAYARGYITNFINEAFHLNCIASVQWQVALSLSQINRQIIRRGEVNRIITVNTTGVPLPKNLRNIHTLIFVDILLHH